MHAQRSALVRLCSRRTLGRLVRGVRVARISRPRYAVSTVLHQPPLTVFSRSASHALWPCESETSVGNEVKIVTALLLSRNVKVTPASECLNPSMPCGGAYMVEFIGSYIVVLVVMFLMVRMGGV